MAKAMLNKLTLSNFKYYINNINNGNYNSVEIRNQSLADAISPFTEEQVDANNVADVLFDLLKLA
ncbi:hypothetical protein [Aerococcus christensenii]|nr:hypothetical protein [Aerococcus christensenii]MDK8234531.1 hypothetical protein [Aerococcus christensenii]